MSLGGRPLPRKDFGGNRPSPSLQTDACGVVQSPRCHAIAQRRVGAVAACIGTAPGFALLAMTNAGSFSGQLKLPLHQHVLELRDCLGGVQALGTDLRAV